MALKADYEEAGLSLDTINQVKAAEYKENFRKAFGIEDIPLNFKELRNEYVKEKAIRINKLGLFISKNAIADILTNIGDSADGLKLSYCLDDNNNLELIGEIVKFSNDDEGNYKNTPTSEKVYYSVGPPQTQPPVLPIPPMEP